MAMGHTREKSKKRGKRKRTTKTVLLLLLQLSHFTPPAYGPRGDSK